MDPTFCFRSSQDLTNKSLSLRIQMPNFTGQGSYVEGLRLSCGEYWECFFYHEIRHPNKVNGLGLVARVKPLVATVKLLVARVKPRPLQLRSSCDRNSGKPLKILHFSWDLNATNPYLQGVSLQSAWVAKRIQENPCTFKYVSQFLMQLAPNCKGHP